MIVTETVILRMANALNLGVEVEELYETLRSEGFSDYDTFLAIRGGQVYNKISDRTYIEVGV
jgi:hypothetical protein